MTRVKLKLSVVAVWLGWLASPQLLAQNSAPPNALVTIDGKIDSEEWAEATLFDQFVSLQPLDASPVPKTLATTAWLQATPQGLAVAIRALQPMTLPRLNQQVKRDFQDQVDRVNFMVDFNGDGRSGFSFTVSASSDIADEVIVNEVQFNPDFDGDWQHAVQATEAGYEYEILIPYSITQIKPAIDGKRTIRVYFDRVIGSSGQRFGFPFASFTRPRFLSDFHPLVIPAYEQSLLAITPYAVVLQDFLANQRDQKIGIDVLWKPSSQHQFALSLNPDFGQVESDQLVVNFDAIETFFTDKRPFFPKTKRLSPAPTLAVIYFIPDA